MNRTFDEKIGELRVTLAYIELLWNPEKEPGARIIPVVRSGNYEIRVLQLLPNGSDGEPTIWMELFDHRIQLPVNRSHCREIEDAMDVFKEFVAQVKSLDEASGSRRTSSHDD